MNNGLNRRVDALRQHQRKGEDLTPMTDAERDRRLQALIGLYEERGWQPRGDVAEDRRFRGILYVMVRAAERAAKEDPTPEALASAELWRGRQARFTTVPS